MTDDRKAKNMKKRKTGNIWGILLLICAGLGLAGILAVTVRAAGETGVTYRYFAEADPAQGAYGTLSFDDRLYASAGYGIEILPGEPEGAERLAAFLPDAMGRICGRIWSAGLAYSMILSIAASLFWAQRLADRPGRHTLAAVLCPAGIYAVYLACAALALTASGARFSAPQAGALPTLAAGLLSVCGGGCALGWLLRRERLRILFAILAVPAGAVLLVTGMLAEGRLFSVPEVDSFDGVYASVTEEELNRMYYDEEKNVMVLDGKEYPPERMPNPDRAAGIGRAALIVFEALDPYSGTGLDMIRQIDGTDVPGAAVLPYLLKAALWTALPLCLRRKRDRAGT